MAGNGALLPGAVLGVVAEQCSPLVIVRGHWHDLVGVSQHTFNGLCLVTDDRDGVYQATEATRTLHLNEGLARAGDEVVMLGTDLGASASRARWA